MYTNVPIQIFGGIFTCSAKNYLGVLVNLVQNKMTAKTNYKSHRPESLPSEDESTRRTGGSRANPRLTQILTDVAMLSTSLRRGGARCCRCWEALSSWFLMLARCLGTRQGRQYHTRGTVFRTTGSGLGGESCLDHHRHWLFRPSTTAFWRNCCDIYWHLAWVHAESTIYSSTESAFHNMVR